MVGRKLHIVLAHGNDGTDVRVGKICRSLSQRGHRVSFVGWDRRPGSVRSIDLGGATPHMLVLETKHGRATPDGMLRYSIHVLKCLARLKPDVLCVVNEDNALPLLPFKGLLYRRLVVDVFDALADRHSGAPAPLALMLRLAQWTVRKRADRLIATDDRRHSRFGAFQSKTIVVENVPEDPGDDLAERSCEGPPTLFVSGALSRERGLAQLLAAAERVPNLRIVCAGWLYDDLARDTFAKHPSVTYLGVLTARECLERASECDAIFAFYAAKTVNNVFASPNKLYDAMSLARPVIVNEEVRVAQWVREKELGYVCPYDDTTGLSTILASLAERRASDRERGRGARALFLKEHTWARMVDRLEAMYAEIGESLGETPAGPLR